MAIPTYDKLMRPVLELATQQPINRRTATDAIAATIAADSFTAYEEFVFAETERQAHIKDSWRAHVLTARGLASFSATFA
jgi:restriction endonuclease Mrr